MRPFFAVRGACGGGEGSQVMSADVTIVPLSRSVRDIRRFLRVARGLYAPDSLWVAPLELDQARVFTLANPFFEHAEMQLWVARRKGADVGRIAAILDHHFNHRQPEPTAFFGFYESVNDPAVAAALFEAASRWARERGQRRLLGPMNPTTNDECGLLVSGFEEPPAFMMPYNPPCYPELVEALGFRKARDLLAFHVEVTAAPLERLRRLAEKTRRRYPELVFRPVRRRTLARDLALIKEVYNAAWEDNWGFVPMTDAEITFTAARLKPLLVEGLVWLVESPDAGPVAFMLALPDFNEALRPLRGQLLTPRLFRFLTYLFGWRCPRHCRVVTLGIKASHRGRGLEAVMLDEGFKTGLRLGFKTAEASWVLEDNVAMCRFMEAFGARVNKVYRLYEKAI